MAIPASGVARLGIDGPVTALDTLRDQVVDEGALPGPVRLRPQVTPAVAIADAGLAARPVQIAAEFADHHGVALVLEITEVLFPATALERGIDHDVAPRVAGCVALEPRALRLRRI